MEITKEHFDMNFVLNNYKEYLNEFKSCYLRPKDYFGQGKIENINSEVMVAGEIGGYALLTIAGVISALGQGEMLDILLFPLVMAAQIYPFSYLFKIIIEFFEAPQRDMLYYRNYIRLSSFGLVMAKILPLVLPFFLYSILAMVALGYAIYLCYQVLTLEFKVSNTGRNIFMGMAVVTSCFWFIAGLISIFVVTPVISSL